MTGLIEDIGMRAEGLNDQDIAMVNKRIPDLIYYFQLIKKEHARLGALIDDLEPIVEKVLKKQETLT